MTDMDLRYKREFPDMEIESEILNFLATENFMDTSWHNDAMPSFWNEAEGLCVWVDYPEDEREKSECPSNIEYMRFFVSETDEDGAYIEGEELNTNSWEEVKIFIELYIYGGNKFRR